MPGPMIFPRALLDAAPEVRLAHFDRVTIAHPVLVETDAALRGSIARAARGTIVLVFGPAGSGKTTLLARTEQWLVERAMPELKADPNGVAAVRVEAVTEGQPGFHWGDYYRRVLMALDEPLVDDKVDPKARVFRADEGVRRFARRRATVGDLRYAVEQALAYRRPAACLVDEAHHLAKTGSGRRLLDQLDTVKSLANLAGVPHVLVGSYGLLDFSILSGQLSRRSVLLHLRRYRGDSAADVHAFQRAVLTFQRHLPLEEEPDLVASWEYLMIHSVGCIGNLKDWLRRALHAAIADGGSLKVNHLERTALGVAQCRSIAAEAWEGEQRLFATAESTAELRRLTGFDVREESSDRSAVTRARSKGSAKKPGRPGSRLPKRDRVGADAC